MNRGIVLGKFYPLHLGHISLIKFAEQMVDELIILVDNHESYELPLADRITIIQRTFPHLKVRGIQESTYQDPLEHHDFWNYWNNIIKKYIPEDVHTIIGSMDYVKDLAKSLNCNFIIIDVERKGINIAATDIRNDVVKNWEYLAPESKPYYLKNIAIVGAESCGKSTLTHNLAQYFNTNYVPEYGRTFVEKHGQEFNSKDLGHIARAHAAHANVLKTMANKVFFYDTEAVITHCWNKFFFSSENKEIENSISQQKIDLYILVPVQDSWVKDDVRYHPEKEVRINFYNEIKNELIKRKLNFIELKSKSWNKVFEESVKKIKEIL